MLFSDWYFQVDAFPSAMSPGTDDVITMVVARSHFDAHGCMDDTELSDDFAGLAPGVLDEEVSTGQFASEFDAPTTRAALLTLGMVEKKMF